MRHYVENCRAPPLGRLFIVATVTGLEENNKSFREATSQSSILCPVDAVILNKLDSGMPELGEVEAEWVTMCRSYDLDEPMPEFKSDSDIREKISGLHTVI